ncbi:hypothetical protein JTE90_007597 [Oedothorax gibbosus]|uniref:Uncharacterized protein n=1 Tax=Oedothorax gibbosus TaxID=931172 RepID=A0AAV6U743_9ARAC|nr:hypothetical protein JTE90_007597 [Oedothorax gibbosus]
MRLKCEHMMKYENTTYSEVSTSRLDRSFLAERTLLLTSSYLMPGAKELLRLLPFLLKKERAEPQCFISIDFPRFES